jgi:hypothetical protein
VILFAACESDSVCHQDLVTAAQVTIQADSLDSIGDTIRYARWDSVAFWGVGADYALQGYNLKSVNLELRPDANQTKYLVLYHEQVDTLYIQHTPRMQYIDLACGCAVYHTITAAWSSDPRIDSISIINASVESMIQENLRIYLHE